MVSRPLAGCVVVLQLAFIAGCELVVDAGPRVVAPSDDGGDGGELPAEAGPPEASQPEVGADCAVACIGPETSCIQTCADTQASCLSGCAAHGSGSCHDQCIQAGTDCSSGCSSRCVTCLTRTACSGASACPG